MDKAPGLLGVMLCAVLLACASTGEAPREDAEAPVTVVHSWEEACADERCLTVLCEEASCAFVRCQDVRGFEEGEVVPARGGVTAPPAPRGTPRRRWGGLWLPESREPVFIIPWNNVKNPHRSFVDMRQLGSQRPWVLHHIFPQEPQLARWFRGQGINIHRYTIPIPQSLHTYLHSGGPSGGMWNASWREFVRAHTNEANVPHDVIWRHALELMSRYKLVGPFVPYR
jgi:uncharacterized lipoprotein (TIGR02269 family)